MRSRAPYRPLRNLASEVRRRLSAAGVKPPGKSGPHIFRHARAVEMLRASVPQKIIGDVLGHRSTEATIPYLKLATEDLRAIALDVPGTDDEMRAKIRETVAAEPGIGSGSVDELFGSAGVPSGDDGAAATLAGVFSTGTPDASGDLPGRPTRAASTELSLDHVFRDMPRKVEPRRTTGGFSFDQFFSDSAGGTGGAPADDTGQGGGAATGGATPSSGAPGNDIEQFNAWLDGLKKK